MSAKQLRAQIEAEFENIVTILDEIDKVLRPDAEKYSVAELAALSTYVHNIYNGIENTLKRGILYLGGDIRNTPTWHKDLLEDARQAGLINHALQQQLMEYLSFRHFFVHLYVFSVSWEEMKPLVGNVATMVKTVKAAMDSFPFK
jgi:hypothetical protein